MVLRSPSYRFVDLEIVERRTLYQGFFSLQQVQVRHRLFAGGWSPLLTRELFIRDDAVAVLLYDPRCDAVVLIEQFRVGALRDPRSPWLVELVAGIVEPGETDADVARREALEETGVAVGALEKIGSVHLSPGGTEETIHILCGLVDVSGVGGIHGLADEGEDIRALVVEREEAYQGVVNGRINNAATVIGLQWLQLNAARLREQWRAP